jgi:putative sigma-54 modulation protein
MDFRVYFKHMETSLPLFAYAQKKLGERLEKYACEPIEAQVTFSVEAGDHIARCHVLTRSGHAVQVENVDENMYACVDILADKLDKKLRRHKDRVKSHKTRRIAASLPLHIETIEGDDEAIDASDVIQFEKARSRLARAMQHGGASLRQ